MAMPLAFTSPDFGLPVPSTNPHAAHTFTHPHIHTQTHKHTDTDRQTHRQTKTHTHTHTHTHRDTHTDTHTHTQVFGHVETLDYKLVACPTAIRKEFADEEMKVNVACDVKTYYRLKRSFI